MVSGPMHLDLSVAGRLAVAALAGLAVGIEREWSGHAQGRVARFAGVRTFFLLGVLGGLAGWLIEGEQLVPGVLMLGSGVVLTVAAYVMTALRSESTDGTTEVAALVVLALAAISTLGFPLVTGAVVAVMVLALAEKTRIHGAIERLGEPELRAAFQFAVLALVILPVLPEGPYGPYDSIRPRAIWIVVLLFSALNFAGYLISRWIGASRGYAVTGLLGGLVSSTAVTWNFSQRSRTDSGLRRALALGVIGACTILAIRVEIVAAVLRYQMALRLIPYMAPLLVVGTVVFLVLYRRRGTGTSRGREQSPEQARNPLRLGNAIRMALAFQVVLILVPLVQKMWGARGLLASAALIGLTDVDALTYSMSRMQGGAEVVALAAAAIAVGVLSNTILKLVLALALGRGEFRTVAGGGLVALALASGAGFWLATVF
jgi:uncharacterized membrane protein (DUF4010 family)